jgi:hypothetical protein
MVSDIESEGEIGNRIMDAPLLSEAPLSSFRIEPGCILLFSGLTELERRIQHTLHNLWTRCALVVRATSGTPVLLQSTSRPISKDLIVGQPRTGVQIISIDEVLTAFDGYIAFRSVRPKLSQNSDERLAAFSLANHGLPFNLSPYYALRAARRRNRDGNGESYYCTELVAAALQHIGVLAIPPVGRSASNYVPGDFAELSQDLCLTGDHGFARQQTFRAPIALGYPVRTVEPLRHP